MDIRQKKRRESLYNGFIEPELIDASNRIDRTPIEPVSSDHNYYIYKVPRY